MLHSKMSSQPLSYTVALAALFILPLSNLQAGTDDEQTTSAVPKRIPSFLDQPYMLGDWGGERTRLADEGVTFDFNDIGDFLTDVTGSQEHHATYFGRFRASTDIDFNKLAGFD